VVGLCGGTKTIIPNGRGGFAQGPVLPHQPRRRLNPNELDFSKRPKWTFEAGSQCRSVPAPAEVCVQSETVFGFDEEIFPEFGFYDYTSIEYFIGFDFPLSD
jgi:hypothetical protein